MKIKIRQGAELHVNVVHLMVDREDCKVWSLDFRERPEMFGTGGGSEGGTRVYFDRAGAPLSSFDPERTVTVTVLDLPSSEEGIWLVDATTSRYGAWIFCWLERREAEVAWEDEREEEA